MRSPFLKAAKWSPASSARIETENGDVIHIVFPTRSEGGYSVNGVAGTLQQGDSGFLGTVVIDYGAD
jgi:hypothetical protein